MDKLNWNKLKDYRCPKCGGYLNDSSIKTAYHCLKATCDFSISRTKFNEIVNDKYKAPVVSNQNVENNMNELNNLDREVEAEDFSGSPHL